jgi:N-acetylmuramoyl-L-alanine amidase
LVISGTRRTGAAAILFAAGLFGAAGCLGAGAGAAGSTAHPIVGSTPGAADSRSGSSSSAAAAGSPHSSSLSASSLVGKVVAIDPGHDGGNESHPDQIAQLVPQGDGQEKACDDTGTNGNDGYTEHQFNFTVALDVEALLKAKGITVVMTRTDDTGVGPCVNVRAEIGNNAHANAAVSIHADGYDGAGHGYQILTAMQSSGGPANDAASQRLAVDMHTALSAGSGLVPSTYVGTDGYEPRDDIAGLNLSTVPKVLVELGNMRDTGDLALEESPAGQQNMAQAVANGIIAFLENPGG